MIAESTFAFLRKLAANNNREWFTENRALYDSARENFVEFCDEVLLEVKAFEPSFYDTQIKDCIFRINRDVRFSKDKSPYKTHLAAGFGRGGRNSGKIDYYFHLQDEETFIGGGMWQPTAEQLSKFRQEIDYSPDTLKEIIEAKDFRKYFPLIYGGKLKRAPKGFAEDHPDIELLRYKEMFFWKKFSNAEVKSPGFKTDLLHHMKVLKPYLDYLNELFYGD